MMRCDIIDPKTLRHDEKVPRGIEKRAEKYLQASGLVDVEYNMYYKL